MNRIKISLLAGFMALSLQAAEAQEKPPLYTRIANWTIARASWEAYERQSIKIFQPVMDKLLADGVITEYGFDTISLHSAEGPTHSSWFSSKTLAGLEKTIEAIQAATEKMSPEDRKKQDSDFAGSKHRDFLVFSSEYRSRPSTLNKGYDLSTMTTVKPGKNREFREFWKKYFQPTYEQLFNEGTVVAYGLAEEQIHTDKPGTLVTWWVVPNAEALDKVDAAQEAARNKFSQTERRAIGDEFRELTEPGSHRDSMWQIIRYASK